MEDDGRKKKGIVTIRKKHNQLSTKQIVQRLIAVFGWYLAICGIARMIKAVDVYEAQSYFNAFTGGDYSFLWGKFAEEQDTPLDDVAGLRALFWFQGLFTVTFIANVLLSSCEKFI